MVPTAVAVGTITLWSAPVPDLKWWPLSVILLLLAVVAQRATAVTRWLGLGQSLMGAVQALSWIVAGPWAAVLASVVFPLVSRQRSLVVHGYNVASFVIMSCAGWWGFHLVGGELMPDAPRAFQDVALPVAVGSTVQVLANVALIVPGLALLRGHRLPALSLDVVRVLRAGAFNQVLGGVVLALSMWAIEPHGVGLFVAGVPLLVHMAVLGTIAAAELGQARALRTLSRAAQTSDPYVELHGARVAEYAKEIGRHLRLGPHQMESLDLAARLHDIGFVALPPEEGDLVSAHAAQGARMVEGLPFLDAAARLIRESHAPVAPPDGSPCSHPIELRAMQVADAVDAMVGQRPESTVDEICDVLEQHPALYDPRAVNALRSARPVLQTPVTELSARPGWWHHDLPPALRGG